VHEVESEKSYEKARTRLFTANTADQEELTFSDTILTFDYCPGRQSRVMQLESGGWVTSKGKSSQLYYPF
jgi:hypothetical protein